MENTIVATFGNEFHRMKLMKKMNATAGGNNLGRQFQDRIIKKMEKKNNMIDKIFNEDCLEGMKRIPDKSVDLVLCDLPYGTTANAWDSIIPFDKLWAAYKRICKDGASIVLFGSEPFSTLLRHSNLKAFRYDWIWQKNNGSNYVHAKQMPLKYHEIISVFGFGGHYVYNPQGTMQIKKVVSNEGKNNIDRIIRASPNNTSGSYIQDTTNYPKSILRYDRPAKPVHPTQKPTALIRYLIRTYTNMGGWFLTTVWAAEQQLLQRFKKTVISLVLK